MCGPAAEDVGAIEEHADVPNRVAVGVGDAQPGLRNHARSSQRQERISTTLWEMSWGTERYHHGGVRVSIDQKLLAPASPTFRRWPWAPPIPACEARFTAKCAVSRARPWWQRALSRASSKAVGNFLVEEPAFISTASFDYGPHFVGYGLVRFVRSAIKYAASYRFYLGTSPSSTTPSMPSATLGSARQAESQLVVEAGGADLGERGLKCGVIENQISLRFIESSMAFLNVVLGELRSYRLIRIPFQKPHLNLSSKLVARTLASAALNAVSSQIVSAFDLSEGSMAVSPTAVLNELRGISSYASPCGIIVSALVCKDAVGANVSDTGVN